VLSWSPPSPQELLLLVNEVGTVAAPEPPPAIAAASCPLGLVEASTGANGSTSAKRPKSVMVYASGADCPPRAIEDDDDAAAAPRVRWSTLLPK